MFLSNSQAPYRQFRSSDLKNPVCDGQICSYQTVSQSLYNIEVDRHKWCICYREARLYSGCLVDATYSIYHLSSPASSVFFCEQDLERKPPPHHRLDHSRQHIPDSQARFPSPNSSSKPPGHACPLQPDSEEPWDRAPKAVPMHSLHTSFLRDPSFVLVDAYSSRGSILPHPPVLYAHLCLKKYSYSYSTRWCKES